MIDDSPQIYARHLATYIACPQKIRNLTRNYFGYSPTLDQCRFYRGEVERRDDSFKRLAHRPQKEEPKFPCGHGRTEDNTFDTLAGNPRCLCCYERVQDAAVKRRDDLKAIEARRIAERELRAARIAELIGLMRADPACPVREMVMIAAAVFNTTYADVMSRSRDKYHTRARFAVYLVAKEQGMSFMQLGRRIGRDHSSIMNGYQRALHWIATEPDYAKKIAIVRKAAAL